MLIHYEDDTHASRYLANVEFCFGQTVEPKLVATFPPGEQAVAASKCSNNQNFRTVQFQRYEHPPGFGKFPDGKDAHYLVIRNYLCASMTDCRAAWSTAIVNDWPRLQLLKADLSAANAAYLADLEHRMAPLEAAYQAKLEHFVADHDKASKNRGRSR